MAAAKNKEEAVAAAKNKEEEAAATKKDAVRFRLPTKNVCAKSARTQISAPWSGLASVALDRADVAFDALALHSTRRMVHVKCYVACGGFFAAHACATRCGFYVARSAFLLLWHRPVCNVACSVASVRQVAEYREVLLVSIRRLASVRTGLPLSMAARCEGRVYHRALHVARCVVHCRLGVAHVHATRFFRCLLFASRHLCICRAFGWRIHVSRSRCGGIAHVAVLRLSEICGLRTSARVHAQAHISGTADLSARTCSLWRPPAPAAPRSSRRVGVLHERPLFLRLFDGSCAQS